MSDEFFKDIPDYPNYQVSSLSKVYSRERIVRGKHGPVTRKAKEIKQFLRSGYPSVELYSAPKTSKQFSVHRLVAEAFLPRVEGKEIVNHINGIKNDAMLENLEWATMSENQLHSYAVIGRITAMDAMRKADPEMKAFGKAMSKANLKRYAKVKNG